MISVYRKLCGCARNTDFSSPEEVEFLQDIVEEMVFDKEFKEIILDRITMAQVMVYPHEVNRIRDQLESLFDFIENPPPFDEGKLA